MEGSSNVSFEELKKSCEILKQQVCRSEYAGNPVQLVQFAEHAAKSGQIDVAVECLHLYFSLNPPVNQFLARAHLCKALCSFPVNCLERTKFLEAAQHIQAAVNIAVKFECYHFLVFNASVVLWKLCRPFQKPSYQRICAKPLQSMLKALEEIGEQDYSWRIELQMGLVLGHLDAGLKEEASKVLNAAIQLARKDIPDALFNLLKFQMQYQLGDLKNCEKEIKASPELSAWNKFYKLKSLTEQHSTPTPEVKEKMQALLTSVVSRGTETSSASFSLHGQSMLLAELAELSKQQGYPDLAIECANKMPSDVKCQVLRELIFAEQLCMPQVMYTKQAVEIRLKAIKRTEEALTCATRIGDPDLVQRSCIQLWNLGLPLLQHNLSHHLLKPFRAAAYALESIDSLLHSLRCCIHSELAKVLADDGQLQPAQDHAKKALMLDYAGEYSEQLNHFLSRLVLRSHLFDTPQSTLDKAAKIIEQVGSNSDQGDISALLTQAGDMMAPNCFLHIVSSFDITKSDSKVEWDLNGKKLQLYEQAVQQVSNHAKMIGTDSDRERCYLWSDLVKVARKAGVWNVATAAAKLCLVYDDGRWSSTPTTRKSESRALSLDTAHLPSSKLSRAMSSALDSAASDLKQSPSMSEKSKGKADKALIRILAKVHCLHAEALIYMLQQDGLKLSVSPKMPAKHLYEDQDLSSTQDAHQKYCNWVLALTNDAQQSFLKAAEHGCSLKEPWLICNAAAYFWNHSHHLVEDGKFMDLVEVFKPLLSCIKQVQSHFNPELFCQISSVIAHGIVQKWSVPTTTQSMDTDSSSTKKKAGRGATPKKGKSTGDIPIDPEAVPHIKEALDICEAAMSVANLGVGLLVRWHLLSAWVQCKQFLQQPVSRDTLGHENEADTHLNHCRAIVATEMIGKLGNGIWEFPNCPTLNEVYNLIQTTGPWEEKDIELELLAKLAGIAVIQKDYSIAIKLTEAALELESKSHTNSHQKKACPSNTTMECELLSQICCLLGQCLEATANGSRLQLERAIEAYFKSARFGHEAKNYFLVVKACQHYWNACLPIACYAADRALLQKPLNQLLNFLELFNPKKGYQSTSSTQGVNFGTQEVSQSYDLQTAMYGLVFEIYSNKSLWKESLKAVEEAMHHTPKDIHRYLMQYKLIFKSKVGRSVDAELVHFQDEPEDVRAALWHKVAKNSTDVEQQARAYQEAIALLDPSVHGSLKIEYLIEFGQWLYNHAYPPEQAAAQLQLAIKLLLMRTKLSPIEAKNLNPTPSKSPIPSAKIGIALNTVEVAEDISTLDSCMRAYTMISQIENVTSKKGLDNTLLSLGCCMRMWKSTFSCFGRSTNGNVKGKVSMPAWPIAPEDWASFSMPEELKTLIKDSKDSCLINICTIQKPYLSIHYLGLLVDDLSKAYLHPLSIPALLLQLSIAECIIQCQSLVCLLHRRIAALCLMLGLKSAASHHNEKAGPSVDVEDIARARAEASLFRAKKKEATEESSESSFTHHEQNSFAADHVLVCPDTILLREVWLQQAQLLIDQGQYQPARQLLDESFQSCEIYQDKLTLGRVLLTQASLAVVEKNYSLATELLQNLHKLPLTIMMWLQSVLLLCEVVGHDETDLESLNTVLKHSLNVLSGRQRKNETHLVEYARSKLRAKCAIVSISKLEGTSLLEQCEILSDCADNLTRLGHQCDATELWSIEANTLKCTGLTMKGKPQYKQILLKALDSYHKSRCSLQILWDVTKELCKPSEVISLPIQRKLVSSMLGEASLLATIFEDHTQAERDLRNKRSQKSSVEKLIEEYVKEEADHCTEDQVWSNTSRFAMEQVLSLLLSAHNLASEEDMRLQSTYALGHFLVLLSEHTSPYGSLQWRSWEGPGSSNNGVAEGHLSALSVVMRKEEAERNEACEMESLQLSAQATQCLAQSVHLALQCGNLEVAKNASFQLMQFFGCHDPTSSAQYLALYQSCAVSLEFHRLLPLLHGDIYRTEIGALLLQNSHISPLLSHTPTADANLQKLQLYECWKRLGVTSGHLDTLRNLPSHFRCIVFQHSPDKTQLYAAYLIPPQPPPPAPKKGQTPVPIDIIKPVVCCVSVAPKAVQSLLALAADFKKELAAAFLKEKTMTSSMYSEQTQSACADILAATEEYLSEAISPISKVLQRESVDKKLVIVILADTTLLQLPLESLSFLQSSNIIAVCRDFSLQMLQHRMAKFQADSASGTTEDNSKDKKKGEKFVAPPSTLLADPANFKYILDPRNESSSGGFNPVNEIIETFQSFPKITSKWNGLKGSDHIISSGEWPSLIRGCSGLIFFGCERFPAHFPVAKLTSLNLSNCSMVLLMDHMHTNSSILHQSRKDLGKSDGELQLEQYLHVMMYLSLIGVGCIVANQWCSTIRSNLNFTRATLKGLLSESKTLGEVVWGIKDHHEAAKTTSAGIETVPEQNLPSAPPPPPAEDNVNNYASVIYGLPHLVLVPPST